MYINSIEEVKQEINDFDSKKVTINISETERNKYVTTVDVSIYENSGTTFRMGMNEDYETANKRVSDLKKELKFSHPTITIYMKV